MTFLRSFGCLLLLTSVLVAQEENNRYWSAPIYSSDRWFNPLNWTPHTVPGVNDRVFIEEGPFAVQLIDEAQTAYARELFIGGPEHEGLTTALYIERGRLEVAERVVLGHIDNPLFMATLFLTDVGSQIVGGELLVGVHSFARFELFDGAEGQFSGGVTLGSTSGRSGGLNVISDLPSRSVLEAAFFAKSTGAGLLTKATLNGATLRATRDEARFIRDFTGHTLQVGLNGLHLDTNGFEVGIDGSSHFSGVGTITKTGDGTLNFTATLADAIDVRVAEGVLLLNSTVGGAVTVTDGTLGGTGTMSRVELRGGSLAPGNSPGTMTIGELEWNDGTIDFELGDAADPLLVDTFSTTATDLLWTFLDNGWQTGETYDLLTLANGTLDPTLFGFTNTGAFDGSFAFVGNTLQFTLHSIPEPSTVALLPASLLLWRGARRLRRQGRVG